MRTYSFIFVFLCLAIGITSCHHDGVYDPDSAKNIVDLKVPQGFDWEMSADFPLTVSGAVDSKISVFADKNCQELVATLPVATEEATYHLSVDKATEQLFIQYTRNDGQKSVVPYSLVKTRANNWRLPEDAGAEEWDGESFVMYYPAKSKGWGTLLFEDMWPGLGDYDFNDMAVNYKIQVYFQKCKRDRKEYLEGILISVRLNAMGGNMPYTLCLQLDECQSVQISEIENYTPGQNSFKWENPGVDTWPLISFHWAAKKGTNGGKYYNTEEGCEVSDLSQNQISLMINPKENIELKNHFKHGTYNFFIRHDDGKEIHLKGYKPTEAFAERYAAIVAENDHLDPNIPYCTKDRLVWGIKVPTAINHAKESVDFGEAYPRFKNWVRSGGDQDKKWYEDTEGRNNQIILNN